MNEKEILRDTVRDGKPLEKKTKKYYKPRKKKEEDTLDRQLENSEKPFVSGENFKIPNTVGRYHIGGTKKFSIYMDKKPNWLHRKCMGIFLGWTWEDNK
jgi:hypothetical protein